MIGMSEIPEENSSATWAEDDRIMPSPVGDEREVLVGLLEFHRRTFELTCAGLSQEQLSQRAVEPSTLTLHGLARRRVRDGQPFTLRWLLVYLIAEYARHAGHADLLRERIDGRTGR